MVSTVCNELDCNYITITNSIILLPSALGNLQGAFMLSRCSHNNLGR